MPITMPITRQQIQLIPASLKTALSSDNAELFDEQIMMLKDYLNPPSEQLTEEEQTQKLNDVASLLNTKYGNTPNVFLRAALEFPNSMPTLLAIIANLPRENQQQLLSSTSGCTQGTALMIAAENKQTRNIEMIINLIENIEYREKNEQNKSLALKQELSKTSSSKGNVLMYALHFRSNSDRDLATTNIILSYVETLDPETQKSIFRQLNQWPNSNKKLTTELVKPIYNSIMKLSIAHPEVAHEILSSTTVDALKSLHQQSTKAEQTIRARHQTTNETSSFFGRLFKPKNAATERMSVESEAFNAIGNADL